VRARCARRPGGGRGLRAADRAALDRAELTAFHQLAVEIGLDVLVEIHDEDELEAALAADAQLIGVNQRDLLTFEVDHERAVRMASVIPRLGGERRRVRGPGRRRRQGTARRRLPRRARRRGARHQRRRGGDDPATDPRAPSRPRPHVATSCRRFSAAAGACRLIVVRASTTVGVIGPRLQAARRGEACGRGPARQLGGSRAPTTTGRRRPPPTRSRHQPRGRHPLTPYRQRSLMGRIRPTRNPLTPSQRSQRPTRPRQPRTPNPPRPLWSMTVRCQRPSGPSR